MKITRLDLDGVGSPIGLVTRILKLEPSIAPPIPVEAIALQLDIQAIQEMETDAFEGGLITDEGKSGGFILVNPKANAGRRRFTIGHELAHFLMITHKPIEQGKFLCSRADMTRWSAKENDRYAKMEVEANEFSALLLMPPPMLRSFLKDRDPDLADIDRIAKHFGVSKDAAARSYAEYHNENIAIVIVKDGIVRRFYARKSFPFVIVPRGKPVPDGSVLHRRGLLQRVASSVVETIPDNWINVEYGKKAPKLYEQVYLQQNNLAMILLWLEREPDDDFDPDAERTAKQRLQERQSRWSR